MSSAAKKTILIAGASGLVGSAACRAFAEQGEYRIIACSRRKPHQLPNHIEFVALDLLDKQACKKAADVFKLVSHIAYCAINETEGKLVDSWANTTHATRNASMLENLVDPLLTATTKLEQVTIVHGTKAYGVMLDKHLAVPLKESLPRPEHENFYFNQEDYIQAKLKDTPISWTIFRAQIIAGGGAQSNLNSLLAMAVYAALCKAADNPCGFPGNSATGVIEMTDADLLANALVWSCEARTAQNQVFNITNGDCFNWADMWPVVIDEVGANIGSAQTKSIESELSRYATLWANLVAQHKLNAPADWYAFLGESGALADFALNANRNVITSTIKLRQAGFSQCMDSEACLRKWIRRWRAQQLLPPR